MHDELASSFYVSWAQRILIGLNYSLHINVHESCISFMLMLWAMEDWNGSSYTSSFVYSEGQCSSHFDCKIEAKNPAEYEIDNIRRLEQPIWVDELLNEPESPLQRRHRRSSSDSAAISILNSNEDLVSMTSGECVQQNHLRKTAAKPASKTCSKRFKHQFARNLRLRKLEYIAELETSFQILKAEESEVSAELQYLNHQNLILGMENQVLKQRLESLSQEQHIKYMEQEMLERELARLHILYHQQQQQQQNQQSSIKQHGG